MKIKKLLLGLLCATILSALVPVSASAFNWRFWHRHHKDSATSTNHGAKDKKANQRTQQKNTKHSNSDSNSKSKSNSSSKS